MTDLAIIANDPAALERAADPAQYVIESCERAKLWLVQVLEHGDIDQIVELKSQAEAIRIYTMSKQLGKDAELSAAEIVRRAERGIGVAVRRGQREGRIRKQGDDTRTDLPDRGFVKTLVSPKGYFDGAGERVAVYAITDGVTDEDFDSAVKAAKEEGNLSRANVVRKVKGEPVQAKPPKDGRKRRPITDTARDAGWALRKDVEKIQRVFTDNRYPENKEKVTAHLHGHLAYAVETLTLLIARINPEGE